MHQQGTMRKHVAEMLQHGVVQPSTSPWAAPIELVKEKDGTICFCVDYRELNYITRKEAYPLPHIAETLDALSGTKVFTILELARGYWQIKMEAVDCKETEFATHQGHSRGL